MAWYIAPSLEQLRAELNARWPGRDRASDGGVGDTAHSARISDHNPDYSNGGVVRARDFDEDGIPTDLLLLAAITDYRTNYVIYERKIYTRANGFRPITYTGINPHDKHMHVSIRHGKQYEDDRTPWFTDAVLTSHTTPIPGIDIPKTIGSLPDPLEDDMTPEQDARLARIENALSLAPDEQGNRPPYYAPAAILAAVQEVNKNVGVSLANDKWLSNEVMVPGAPYTYFAAILAAVREVAAQAATATGGDPQAVKDEIDKAIGALKIVREGD